MNEKMKDYRFRMIYELEELVDRISKLQRYIHVEKPGYESTTLEQKQLDAMIAYREALEERIYHEMTSKPVTTIKSDGLTLGIDGKDIFSISKDTNIIDRLGDL